MAKNSRERRVEEYRAKSIEADDLLICGKKDEGLAVIRAYYEKAAQAGDVDYRLFFEAELAFNIEKDYDKAISLLSTAFTWNEEHGFSVDSFLLRNKGVYFSWKGEIDAAIEWYNRALAINPQDAVAMRNMGVSLANKGGLDAAITWLDRALVINPQDANVMREKGAAFLKKGENDAAITWLDQALAINPQDAIAMRDKGVSLANKGELDAAITWLDRALVINPQDAVAMLNKGIALSEKGEEDAAITWFDQALAINPLDTNAMRNKGVALAKKGELDAAIAWFDQALAINPQDAVAIREKGSVHFNKGELDAAITWFDQVLVINPQDAVAMRNMGVALSEKGEEDAAIAWFDRALVINPQDTSAMRQKGVAFSNKNELDDAITWFDRALAIKPQDTNSMRSKGASLANKGELDAAITWFDRALTINPQDAVAMRNMGVALSKKDEDDDAIMWFDRALAIAPQDTNAMREKGLSLVRLGQEDAAIELFDAVTQKNPKDALAHLWWAYAEYQRGDYEACFTHSCQAVKISPKEREKFRHICSLMDKDPDQEWVKLFPENPVTTEAVDRFADLRGLIGRIRNDLGDDLLRFLDLKERSERQQNDFLEPETRLNSTQSVLLVLRKWNSYTPALPAVAEDERSRGGGYFLWHGGQGTVIDPGYNFIENFYEAGCRIRDIDNIIITHAHNDHTIDFESICVLLHQYNARNKSTPKKIRLFLNNGSFLKFSGMLNLKDHDYIRSVCTLNPGHTVSLGDDMQLSVLPAYHDELLSRDQSVGLLFTFTFDGAERKVCFTGDTGLFPLKEGDDLKPDADGAEIWRHYPEWETMMPDLLIAHIGSIKTEELNGDITLTPTEACYANHLGVNGMARMITMLRPKLAVVSEFGEEMKAFRQPLIEKLQDKVINKFFEKNPSPHIPRVVPGDLPFIYNLQNGTFYCCICDAWGPMEQITFQESEDDFYYFCDNERTRFGREVKLFDTSVESYKKKRKIDEWHGLYFLKRD